MEIDANTQDIICAAATPPGKSALAIIRVSGPGSIAAVSNITAAKQKIKPDDSRKLFYDFIIDDDGHPIDEVTIIPYFAPKSYTAEEMVEIICHGGFVSSKAVIDRLVSCGARPAEPGEFTKRAFLNGRISLSQAEAVVAAIEAKSELALKAAARNLKGELYEKVDAIRASIRDLLTLIEAEIDFSEEEIDKTPVAKIQTAVKEQLKESNSILKSYDFGRGLNIGYRIAIVGRANVGKSSLLNAFLKRERAIVTEIPGTTRDTLTEWIDINGFPILLTDTAGLRESEDKIERIGQDRAKQEIENSDLVLFMIDGSEGITNEDKAIFSSINDKPTLVAVNKIDLGFSPGLDITKEFPRNETIETSALKGTGLDELKSRIAHTLSLDTFSLNTAILATERQYLAMKKVCDDLFQTSNELKDGVSGEVTAVYLREALDHLGELVGETTSDDILNDIFSRFCIGK